VSSAATSAAASCYGGGQVRGRAFMSGGLGNPPHRGDLVPIPDDPKINGLGAFPICCWDARPPQSAAKVVLGTHKVLASGEGGWVFGVLCLGLRSASESPCSACLTPYTQTCPACLPVLLCLLYVVLLFRMLGFLRAHQRASGASSGKRVTTPASATAAPSQRAAAERRCARSEQSSRACL
jgi:hypothetical protein